MGATAMPRYRGAVATTYRGFIPWQPSPDAKKGTEPVPDGGLSPTRLPHERLHPDDEETLPWDSVGILWCPGLILVLEDAVPAAALAR